VGLQWFGLRQRFAALHISVWRSVVKNRSFYRSRQKSSPFQPAAVSPLSAHRHVVPKYRSMSKESVAARLPCFGAAATAARPCRGSCDRARKIRRNISGSRGHIECRRSGSVRRGSSRRGRVTLAEPEIECAANRLAARHNAGSSHPASESTTNRIGYTELNQPLYDAFAVIALGGSSSLGPFHLQHDGITL